MNRPALISRLSYLRSWELLNVFMLPGCLTVIVIALRLPTWRLYVYGQFLISLILAEGSFYWHLKLSVVERQSDQLPTYFRRLFNGFKWVNWMLVAGYLPLLVCALRNGWSKAGEPVFATLVWLIGLLECVNYFHYQLMHDTRSDLRYLRRHRKLRLAPIATDLGRAR